MQVTKETNTKPTTTATPVEIPPPAKTTIATQDTFVSSAKAKASAPTSLVGKIGAAVSGGVSATGDALASAFNWATSGLKSLLNMITRNGLSLANATFKAQQKAEEDRQHAAKEDDAAVEAAAEASRQAAAAEANKH